VAVSVKTRIVHTSIHIEKKKILKIIIFAKLCIPQEKYAGINGLVISEGSFKTPKAVYHLICLAMGI